MESPPNLHLRAGLLYLAVVVFGIFALLVAPAMALPQGIGGTPWAIFQDRAVWFRLGVASHLAMQVAFLLLPLALYPLFRERNPAGAVLMVALAVAAVPVGFIGILEELEVLRLLGSLPGTPPDAVEAAVRLALRRSAQGQHLASLFWGLWLFPFGWMVSTTRVLPRVLGWGLLCGGLAYTLDVMAPLLGLSLKTLRSVLHLPGSIGEIGAAVVLTVQGLRKRS